MSAGCAHGRGDAVTAVTALGDRRMRSRMSGERRKIPAHLTYLSVFGASGSAIIRITDWGPVCTSGSFLIFFLDNMLLIVIFYPWSRVESHGRGSS